MLIIFNEIILLEFTLIAPSNAAFREVSSRQRQRWTNRPESMREMLLYHIIPGHHNSSSFENEAIHITMAGSRTLRINIYNASETRVRFIINHFVCKFGYIIRLVMSRHGVRVVLLTFSVYFLIFSHKPAGFDIIKHACHLSCLVRFQRKKLYNTVKKNETCPIQSLLRVPDMPNK